MEKFIKKIEKGEFQIEMIIDGIIFDKTTILKASYELVDKVYMFFKSKGKDILVQFKLKNKNDNLEEILNTFGEELVFHNLRKQIEEKTGDRREKIIETALGFSIGNEEIKKTLQDITEKLETYHNSTDIHLLIEELESIESEIDVVLKLMKNKEAKKGIKENSKEITERLSKSITNFSSIFIENLDSKLYIKQITSLKNDFEAIIKNYKINSAEKSYTKLKDIYSNMWKCIEGIIEEVNKIEGKPNESKKSINEIIGEIKDDDDFTDEDKDEIIAILKDIED